MAERSPPSPLTNLLRALIGMAMIRLLVAWLGLAGVVMLCWALLGTAVLFLAMAAWNWLRLRRLKQSFCDDALFYARKKRKEFDEPDFGSWELQQMATFRRRGDFEAVHRLILASNLKLAEAARAARVAATPRPETPLNQRLMGYRFLGG